MILTLSSLASGAGAVTSLVTLHGGKMTTGAEVGIMAAVTLSVVTIQVNQTLRARIAARERVRGIELLTDIQNRLGVVYADCYKAGHEWHLQREPGQDFRPPDPSPLTRVMQVTQGQMTTGFLGGAPADKAAISDPDDRDSSPGPA